MQTKKTSAYPFIIFSFLISAFFHLNLPAQKTTLTEEQNIQLTTLLSEMTIEEKVGQMTQVTLGMVMQDDNNQEIDIEKLKSVLVDHHVGSILNVNGNAYTVKTWHRIIQTIQDQSQKIPVIYGIDAIHGPSYIDGATLVPHNIGMAATRNPDLVKLAAKYTAASTRYSGIPWNFDPAVGVGRQPLWSRFEETFGEDPLLVSTMGVAAINGYQEEGLSSNRAVAACMKHYIGYSVPKSGKDRTPAYIPDNVLREYFLPPFQAAVETGAATVMINSSEINGVPVHASKYYLTDILRNELGFEGLVVSDWEDVIRLQTRHRVASSPKEAVRIAVEAGLDMSMVPLDFSFYDYLLELVKEGTIPETRIDESVKRILSLKLKLGLFENPFPSNLSVDTELDERMDELALKSALEGMTLLKNENAMLPLQKGVKILLAGPGANNVSSMHGSWSYTWQGDNERFYPASIKTIKEQMIDYFGKENVICSSQREYNAPENYNVEAIERDAQNVDLIVLCLGEKAYAEQVGVIDDLTLDQNQIALAKAAIQSGKKLVLILTEGRPRLISEIEEEMDAILMAYRPAAKGAAAIVQVLSGQHNPSGVLPFTYPRHTGDLLTYDHKYSEEIREDIPDTYNDNGYQPQYDFGYGLSYTTFEYSDLQSDKLVFQEEDKIEVTVTIENTGKVAGGLAVELYSSDLYASITPNVRRLRAFEKIFLKAGEIKKVTFQLDPKKDLSFIDQQSKRVLEKGEFDIMIGTEKIRIQLD